jgi:dTDP-glucose pyrophosphorylase
MIKPSLLILAAGMGSRYGGLKQLDGVGPSGETIMDYSIYDAIRAGFGKAVFVIRRSFRKEFEERARRNYGNYIDLGFVEQELENIPEGYRSNPERVKPWGTGHAVLVAADEIKTPFAAINADDYYGCNSFRTLENFLVSACEKEGMFCMVGFSAANTLSESGSVSRGVCTVDNNGMLISVEEHHNIAFEDGVISGIDSQGEKRFLDNTTPVSMNMWGFTPDIFEKGLNLFSRFLEKNMDNPKSEFYIPYLVDELIKNKKATCRVLSTGDQWFGVTYKEDKEGVVDKLASLTSYGTYPSPLFKKENDKAL